MFTRHANTLLLLFLTALGCNGHLFGQCKSRVAPDLAVMPTSSAGDNHHLFVLFTGHNNDHIWQAMRCADGRWEYLGRVNDGRRPVTSWAFSKCRPCAVDASHLRTARLGLYLVYRGHNNERIWYTKMTWHLPIRAPEYHSWSTPTAFPENVTTNGTPGACLYMWNDSGTAYVNKLTVIYRESDSNWDGWMHDIRPRLLFVREGDDRPRELQTRSGGLIRSRRSPTVVSFRSNLYVFYLDGYRVRCARTTSNNADRTRWEELSVPAAYSTGAPAVTVQQDEMLIAFRGHNNPRIWLARYNGERWEPLQYVPGVSTSCEPTLASYGNTLYLAFKPEDSDEVAVGTLTLGAGDPRRPGHVWRSLR